MTPINYSYFVRGYWAGPRDEKPPVIGAKFLQTLDALSGIDPLFSDWQFTGIWQLPEEHRSEFVPLAEGRRRIEEIVESGVYTDDFNKPCPEYGHSVHAVAGARGPRHVAFSASTSQLSFDLSFGEYDTATDLSIVTYPLFKAALLTMSVVWDARLAYATASRNDVDMIPTVFGAGAPGFIVESAPLIPLDPTFPDTFFRVPWIAYLSAERAAGVVLTPEIATERTPDGGLLMVATEDRLDPNNPDHARHARIIAETMIAATGYQPGRTRHA